MCMAAVALAPADSGLMANLALAYLIDGQLEAAEAAITKSLSIAPDDPISMRANRLIQRVAAGDLPCPKSGPEIMRALRE